MTSDAFLIAPQFSSHVTPTMTVCIKNNDVINKSIETLSVNKLTRVQVNIQVFTWKNKKYISTNMAT